MEFRLHVVRHAEATHNPSHDTSIVDPPLTAWGIKQSTDLNRDFPFKDDVGVVIASPLRRTIQTALLGFWDTIDTRYYVDKTGSAQYGAAFLLDPDLQAHSSRPCDTGSPAAILQSDFPHLPWDMLGLDPVFPAKVGLYAADLEALRGRGLRAQRYLEDIFYELMNTSRPDIVVVLHGGFMRFLGLGDKMTVNQAQWKTFGVTFDDDHRMRAVQLETQSNTT